MLLPEIETERLRLRMYRRAELEDVYRLITDRNVRRFLPEYAIEKADVLASLPRRIQRWRENGFAQLGVFEKASGKLTGYCGLQYLDKTPEVEIYYGFFKEFWGKGYGSEAAKALLRFGFEEAKLEKIVGATHLENFASQGVLQNIGLKREKEIRQLYGTDSVYFSLLREDYQPDAAAKYDLTFTKIDD
jgi:ribosomal-protein-alanine N-acetyltransferase